MSALRNARREAFARAVAAGASATDAYEQAGYRRDNGAACRLAQKPDVAARIAELQAIAAEKAAVTIESIAAELEAARQLAMTKDQASAAVQASMGKAKLFGLLVEKRQHSGPGGGAIPVVDLTNASNEQLSTLEAFFGPLAGPGNDDEADQGGEGAESG